MAEFRQPGDYPERPSGCIDTPFIGPDAHTTSSGVVCGRQRRSTAALLRGRVVSGMPGGLPGPGLEGMWITVHAGEGPVGSQLSAPRTETQSGPQGSFSCSVGVADGNGAEELVLVVRKTPDGPVLAAKRVRAVAGENPDVILIVSPE
ncbi:MAG: hypothetical protein KC431_17065 [Myxococcales bacterium]|nr:hypothetical protein [Myxococcales bacterium]